MEGGLGINQWASSTARHASGCLTTRCAPAAMQWRVCSENGCMATRAKRHTPSSSSSSRHQAVAAASAPSSRACVTHRWPVDAEAQLVHVALLDRLQAVLVGAVCKVETGEGQVRGEQQVRARTAARHARGITRQQEQQGMRGAHRCSSSRKGRGCKVAVTCNSAAPPLLWKCTEAGSTSTTGRPSNALQYSETGHAAAWEPIRSPGSLQAPNLSRLRHTGMRSGSNWCRNPQVSPFMHSPRSQ